MTNSQGPGPFIFGFIVGVIVAGLLTSFFQVGLNRIVLGAVRGETPEFSTLFSGGARYTVAFLCSILLTLGMYGGMLLLVVPGIILMLGWTNVVWFVADSELGATECLKASWDSMNGHKGKYFGFLFALGLVNIAGVLACLVGLVVTVPLTMIAMAVVFTRVTGRVGPAPLTAAPAFS